MWIIDCDYPFEIIKNYIDSKVTHLDAQDSYGNTALHYAYMIGSDETIEYLKSKGAKEIENNDGELPNMCG